MIIELAKGKEFELCNAPMTVLYNVISFSFECIGLKRYFTKHIASTYTRTKPNILNRL